MSHESKGVPASPDSAGLIILTVPAARKTLARLETDRSRQGARTFEVIYGDVDAIITRAGDLLKEWKAMRGQLGIASRFNDPEGFLRGVAGHHGVPCAMFARGGGTNAIVVGVIEDAPLVQRVGYFKIRTPRLRTLRIAETGILCPPNPAASESLGRDLIEFVRSSAIDHLAIHNLSLDHPLSERLATFREAGFGLVRVPRGRWRTQLLDPETGERLVHHSGKTRYTLRRKSKKLDDSFGGRVDLVRIERADQIDDFVRNATSIIRQTYQAALGIGVKDTPAYRQLLLDLAATGALCGYELRAGELAIAYMVGDIHDKTFRLWATSFLPQHGEHSPGLVLLWRALDDLAVRGVALFDFGFGEAEYKAMLGSEHVEECDWRVYARSLRGRMAFLSDRLTGSLDAVGRRLLRSRNLIQRVKKMWRARLEKLGGHQDGDADTLGSGPGKHEP